MTDITSIIAQLEEQKAAIEKALAALRSMGSVGSSAPSTRESGRGLATRAPGRPTKKRRRFSEETRKRMAEAQKKRWAAKKKR